MKYSFTPELFNNLAISLFDLRWRMLICSIFSFALSYLLQRQLQTNTPEFLLYVTLFMLFLALQSLVISAFIFFFQALPSNKNNDQQLTHFYRVIEWCETVLFTILLPLPAIMFCYAVWVINLK